MIALSIRPVKSLGLDLVETSLMCDVPAGVSGHQDTLNPLHLLLPMEERLDGEVSQITEGLALPGHLFSQKVNQGGLISDAFHPMQDNPMEKMQPEVVIN